MFVGLAVFTHWDFLVGISFWISRRGPSDWMALLLRMDQPGLQRAAVQPRFFVLVRLSLQSEGQSPTDACGLDQWHA
jgi:hypothetical protein